MLKTIKYFLVLVLHLETSDFLPAVPLVSVGFCSGLSLLCGSGSPSEIWNNTRIARLFGGLKELQIQCVPLGLCKLS